MDKVCRMKCAPTLPSSSSSSNAADQIPAHDVRNQMMMNIGHHSLPHDAREPILLAPGVKQAPSFSNLFDSGSSKPANSESGNLFLSIISDTPFLQYDTLHKSNLKPTSGSCYPNHSVHSNVNTVGSRPFSHNSRNLDLKAGTEVHPVFPLRYMMSANKSNSHGMHDNPNSLRALINQPVSRNESAINNSLQKGCALSSSHNGEPAHGLTSNTMSKTSLGSSSSISAVASECPRVFCMAACGDLLLSNTGLFGILCSCHGMHMSIPKFVEHSGLSDVNPGHAVRMESGESIAQWRKVYLQNFGIRAPEDHRGWDWPEVFLGTSAIANSSVDVAEGRKIFDLSSLFTSSTETVKSSQPRNNVSISRAQTSQYSNNMSKAAKREKNFDPYTSYHVDLVGSSRRTSHTVLGNPAKACTSPSCSMMSKGAHEEGSGDGCRSRSHNFNIISTSGNSVGFEFQNSQKVGCKTKDNLKDDNILRRCSLPSSIELKLGQPSHLGWGAASASQASHRTLTFDVQAPSVQEKMTHNSRNLEVVEDNQHKLHHFASNLSRKQPFQPGLLVAAPSTRNSAQHVMRLHDRSINRSSFSVLTTSSSTSTEKAVHHKKVTKGIADTHPSSPWTPHHQPNADRSSQIRFSCNGNESVRPLNLGESVLQNNKIRTADSRFGHNESNLDLGSDSNLHVTQTESAGFFSRYGKDNRSGMSMVSDGNCTSLGMATLLPCICVASIYNGNTSELRSCAEQDHFAKGTLGFERDPSLHAVSTALTTLTSVLPVNNSSAFVNRDAGYVSPHMLGESLRRIALTNVRKSVNEIPLSASHGLNQQLRTHSNQKQQSTAYQNSDWRVQGPLDPARLEEQRCGHLDPVERNGTPTSLSGAGLVKGTNTTENVRAFSQGTVRTNEGYSPQLTQRCPDKARNFNMLLRGCGDSYDYNFTNGCSSSGQTISFVREQDTKDIISAHGIKKQDSIATVQAPKLIVRSSADGSACMEMEILKINQKEKEQSHCILNCSSSQRRDVPSKAKELLFKMRREYEAQSKEFSAEVTAIDSPIAESSKGKESSVISSECSELAITQVSNEFKKIDSCIVDGGVTGSNSDQIVDQGSATCSELAIDSIRDSHHVCCEKPNSNKSDSSNILHNSLYDEIKQTCSKSSNVQTIDVSGASLNEVSDKRWDYENEYESRKRKRTVKWRLLEASVSVSEVSSSAKLSPLSVHKTARHQRYASEGAQFLQSNQISCKMLDGVSSGHGLKNTRSALCQVKMLSRKRDFNGIYSAVEVGQEDQTVLKGNAAATDIPVDTTVKKSKKTKLSGTVRKHADSTNNMNGFGLHKPTKETLNCSLKVHKKVKPIACGKYGIICDQELDIDQLKPPKIVSLSKVLNSSRYCARSNDEPEEPSVRKSNNVSLRMVRKCSGVSFNYCTVQSNHCKKVLSCDDINSNAAPTTQILDRQGNGHSSDDLSVWAEDGASVQRDSNISICLSTSQSKTKEIRMRSLYDLSMRGNKSMSADVTLSVNVLRAPSRECDLEKNAPEDAGGSEGSASKEYAKRSSGKPRQYPVKYKKDALCCVCGIPKKDYTNCLLKCQHCLIQVHQACYGISRVPKGDWFCRPCRTSSKDVVCVLCGYGDGAMTRAFGSRNVVKSLLSAWNIRTESHIMIIGSTDSFYVPAKMEHGNKESLTNQSRHLIKPVVHNSIVAGLFDPMVKQWVHMVCGLWTPGTRCPNVDTMSAFDVSGIYNPKAHVICHICDRPGGSCIRCRIETCCAYFHPWCAHQKGLLQSEVEGTDRDKVGFYGRCLLHINNQSCILENDSDIDKNYDGRQEVEPTCARAEAYEGRKPEEKQRRSCHQRSEKGGCLVTQVQLDAWLYINQLKRSMKRQPRPPISDTERDYRKEYAKLKQAKGWKHLVVYKSGIHALGLYTSQFIPRDAMVVEYIGEIVGMRVADKRETEYLSGRKLQYKSACYFFRLDKEHIIDATVKGGIARYVNHSCEPNCFAKVISVRSEKKVVFFALRDIYPGAEITYDYHFNREDEGKKIPCLCNAKNCRRYLN